MKKTQPLWVFLIIASISAVTAIAVERSLWGTSEDRLDRDVQALQRELDRSEAQRDSLNQLLTAHQDTLIYLATQERTFEENLSLLRLRINEQDSIINQFSLKIPDHDISTDSLLDDLNAIARALYAGRSPGDNTQ